MRMKTWCTALLVALTASLLTAASPAPQGTSREPGSSGTSTQPAAGKAASTKPLTSHEPPARTQTASVPAPAFDRALLDKYCVTCHNERRKSTAGNLALDSLDASRIGDRADQWEKVVAKLRGREMPPAGSPRPDDATYKTAIAALETSLDRAAAANPNPGRVAVHRLNRAQYANAVRDLLGVDVDVTTMLRPDETGYGFDNIADVLTISPALLEEYKLAAWKISRLAVGDPTIRPAVATYKVSRFIDQEYRLDEDLPFGTRGGTVIRHTFPLDGEYSLKINLQRAYAQNVIKGLREKEQIDVRLNGEQIKLFVIGGECVGSKEPRCVAFQPDLKVASGVRVLPAEYDLFADKDLVIRFKAKAGPSVITAAFLEHNVTATEGGGAARKPLGQWQADTGDGLMAMDEILLEGPFDAKVPADTPSRQRIFTCHPSGNGADAACARQILTTLSRRAYRGRVAAGDVDALMKFYEKGRQQGSFDTGIQMALEAVLMAPKFLLRVNQEPVRSTAGNYELEPLDLASRMSFFLWSTIPDDELLDLAANGRLRDRKVVQQQVKRMLADPRSHALIKGFFASWLSLRDLQNVQPDPAMYPDFDDNLRQAFLTETEMFLESQLTEDHGIPELLTADYTYLNERLAKFYGVPHIYGARFRRVTMTDPNRNGLLGHGSVLTVTSYSTRTSPVVRGKWLLSNILGSPPPAPPPNVPALVEAGEGGAPPSTVRERMSQHRKNAVCASCHRRIDPMGFALENYNAIGRWRTTEFGLPIDSTGAFPDGSEFRNPSEFRTLLMRQSDEFVKTVTTKMLTYALGRGVEYYDMPAVREIMRSSAAGNYRWSSVIEAVVTSLPFRMNRAAEPAPGENVARR